MAHKYMVFKQNKLLPFLFETLSLREGWPKKRVKQRLRDACILVNGVVRTKHDHFLDVDDIVEIDRSQFKKHISDSSGLKLDIIYQDKGLIAINKPAELLSVGTSKENKNHALALLRTQLGRGRQVETIRLWPVHRLDRDTSGIMLFATSKELRENMMCQWSNVRKSYLAIVQGVPEAISDTINQPLRLDESEYRMHVGEHKDAKPAITHYRVRKSSNGHTLLEVDIETGRQHQIRAHMSWMGNPIVGDERYGTKANRMGLHAQRLVFIHPITNRQVSLVIDAPREFYALMRG